MSSKRAVVRKLLVAVASAALFLLIWALLDALVNARYPARVEEPPYWYLLPSVDLTVLLALFALLGWLRVRVPVWANAVVASLLAFVRLFRFSDGLIQQNYFRPVNLYLDVPLLPELVRLLHSTVSLSTLLVGGVIATLGLAAALFAIYGGVTYLQRFVAAGWWQRGVFALPVMAALALSSRWPAEDNTGLHTGMFASSVVPRLRDQVRFALEASELRRAKSDEIAHLQKRLSRLPSGLEKLRGADVFVFFVESYGATVFRRPEYFARINPVHTAFAAELGRRGFAIASNLLDSPTYGGGSWLAHATFATGVPTKDGLDYALLRQTRPQPKTLAWFFAQAGYRTVLVQPGTTRPFPEGTVHGFERKYYEPDLGYRGPSFAWATMPDQYVVDFVHRREVAAASRPLFIEYALVTSHAPWALQPPIVEDWSRIQNGEIYRETRPVTFPIRWDNLGEGGEAYVTALVYDFEVLKRYLGEHTTRNALFVILGDHQPPGSVTGRDPSPAVPIHLLSRDRSLVDAFAADGFVPGMNPPVTGQVAGMETFLTTWLERLSVQR